MPVYKFKCKQCGKETDEIVKLNQENIICSCRGMCKRLHGRDIPAPPVLYGEGSYKQSKRQDVA